MKRMAIYLLFMLLTSTAVLSCSTGLFDKDASAMPSENPRTILITGSAIDSQSGSPLENITISFKAYPYEDPEASPVSTVEVHTNSKGTFSLHAEGATQKLLCILVAKDKEGLYESQTKQVIVTWTGTSFDRYNNIFIVNDCKFNLEKTR